METDKPHQHIWVMIEDGIDISIPACYDCDYFNMRGNTKNCDKYPSCIKYYFSYHLKPYEQCCLCNTVRVKTHSGYAHYQFKELTRIHHYKSVTTRTLKMPLV